MRKEIKSRRRLEKLRKSAPLREALMVARHDKEMRVPEDLRYCKDCNSRGSWERCPAKDWVYESGKVLEYGFRCKVCGAITLRPTLEPLES